MHFRVKAGPTLIEEIHSLCVRASSDPVSHQHVAICTRCMFCMHAQTSRTVSSRVHPESTVVTYTRAGRQQHDLLQRSLLDPLCWTEAVWVGIDDAQLTVILEEPALALAGLQPSIHYFSIMSCSARTQSPVSTEARAIKRTLSPQATSARMQQAIAHTALMGCMRCAAAAAYTLELV